MEGSMHGGSPTASHRAPAAAGRESRAGPVEDILNRLDTSGTSEMITVRELMASFGRQSFVPFLMVPALLVISPLSGIPLFSSACGFVIALVAFQMLWPGRDTLWLPRRLMRQNVSARRARPALQKLVSVARWLDRHARDRLGWLVQRRPGRSVLEAICMLAGLAMPLFEVVPLSSSILGFGVVLIATGLLTRDGLFACGGLAVLSLAPLVPVVLLGGIG